MPKRKQPYTRIYTKAGDRGETSLFSGERVLKDSIRVEAYGTVDELNSCLGVAKTLVKTKRLIKIIENVQKTLFQICTGLATSPLRRLPEGLILREEAVKGLEVFIDELQPKLVPITRFIFPGGTLGGSWLHFARTVSRRAERRVITLRQKEEVNPLIIKYLNRLSDLLYILARTENQRAGKKEVIWEGYFPQQGP